MQNRNGIQKKKPAHFLPFPKRHYPVFPCVNRRISHHHIAVFHKGHPIPTHQLLSLHRCCYQWIFRPIFGITRVSEHIPFPSFDYPAHDMFSTGKKGFQQVRKGQNSTTFIRYLDFIFYHEFTMDFCAST